jgi:protein O-GlcNAc transferase
MSVKTLLVVGCGPKGILLPREFAAYRPTRLDADESLEPDIVASMVAMPMIADKTYDGAHASHVIEHLYFHEVTLALQELWRVLKPGGLLRIAVPDLQAFGSMLALDKADNTLYVGGLGPVAPVDMLYGHRGHVAQGNVLMAHKSGFTGSLLKTMLQRAGFKKVEIDRETKFELIARATKGADDASEVAETEGAPQCEVRPCLGEETPLRQQGQVACAG